MKNIVIELLVSNYLLISFFLCLPFFLSLFFFLLVIISRLKYNSVTRLQRFRFKQAFINRRNMEHLRFFFSFLVFLGCAISRVHFLLNDYRLNAIDQRPLGLRNVRKWIDRVIDTMCNNSHRIRDD